MSLQQQAPVAVQNGPQLYTREELKMAAAQLIRQEAPPTENNPFDQFTAFCATIDFNPSPLPTDPSAEPQPRPPQTLEELKQLHTAVVAHVSQAKGGKSTIAHLQYASQEDMFEAIERSMASKGQLRRCTDWVHCSCDHPAHYREQAKITLYTGKLAHAPDAKNMVQVIRQHLHDILGMDPDQVIDTVKVDSRSTKESKDGRTRQLSAFVQFRTPSVFATYTSKISAVVPLSKDVTARVSFPKATELDRCINCDQPGHHANTCNRLLLRLVADSPVSYCAALHMQRITGAQNLILGRSAENVEARHMVHFEYQDGQQLLDASKVIRDRTTIKVIEEGVNVVSTPKVERGECHTCGRTRAHVSQYCPLTHLDYAAAVRNGSGTNHAQQSNAAPEIQPPAIPRLDRERLNNVCFSYCNSKQCADRQCRFGHEDPLRDDLRQVCIDNLRFGYCKYGTHCYRIHTEEALRLIHGKSRPRQEERPQAPIRKQRQPAPLAPEQPVERQVIALPSSIRILKNPLRAEANDQNNNASPAREASASPAQGPKPQQQPSQSRAAKPNKKAPSKSTLKAKASKTIRETPSPQQMSRRVEELEEPLIEANPGTWREPRDDSPFTPARRVVERIEQCSPEEERSPDKAAPHHNKRSSRRRHGPPASNSDEQPDPTLPQSGNPSELDMQMLLVQALLGPQDGPDEAEPDEAKNNRDDTNPDEAELEEDTSPDEAERSHDNTRPDEAEPEEDTSPEEARSSRDDTRPEPQSDTETLLPPSAITEPDPQSDLDAPTSNWRTRRKPTRSKTRDTSPTPGEAPTTGWTREYEPQSEATEPESHSDSDAFRPRRETTKRSTRKARNTSSAPTKEMTHGPVPNIQSDATESEPQSDSDAPLAQGKVTRTLQRITRSSSSAYTVTPLHEYTRTEEDSSSLRCVGRKGSITLRDHSRQF